MAISPHPLFTSYIKNHLFLIRVSKQKAHCSFPPTFNITFNIKHPGIFIGKQKAAPLQSLKYVLQQESPIAGPQLTPGPQSILNWGMELVGKYACTCSYICMCSGWVSVHVCAATLAQGQTRKPATCANGAMCAHQPLTQNHPFSPASPLIHKDGKVGERCSTAPWNSYKLEIQR